MDCSEFQKPVDGKKTIFALCWSVITSIAYIFFWVIIIGFLLSLCTTGVSFSSSMLKANMTAVGARGRDIYVAITEQNNLPETSNLPSIWPKTCQGTTNSSSDISGNVFKTSTEYFAALYDEEHVGTLAWKPWIQGFDYSKLAGAGVSAATAKGKLQAKNNMWLIAANITDEDPDIIPILITRNVDVKEIERLVNCGGATSNLNAIIAVGKGDYKTPFGEKGFVLVRKSGGIYSVVSKYARLKYIFNSQELPPRDPSKPPIVYLMP